MEQTTPQVRIGDWVSEGWRMFVEQWKSWVLMTLVVALITTLPIILFSFAIVIVALGSIDQRGPMPRGPMPSEFAPTIFLLYAAMGVFALLMMPVHAYFSAGMYRAAFKQLRGGQIEFRDLFSGGDCFLRLLGANIVLAALAAAGFVFCIIPAYIVLGMLFFAAPLIVERRAGAFEAVGESWNLGKTNVLMFTLWAFLVSLIASAGSYACYVGLLATIPLQYTMGAIAYRDCFGVTGARSFKPLAPVTPAAPQYGAAWGGGFCPQCRSSLPEGASFCPSCGARVGAGQ